MYGSRACESPYIVWFLCDLRWAFVCFLFCPFPLLFHPFPVQSMKRRHWVPVRPRCFGPRAAKVFGWLGTSLGSTLTAMVLCITLKKLICGTWVTQCFLQLLTMSWWVEPHQHTVTNSIFWCWGRTCHFGCGRAQRGRQMAHAMHQDCMNKHCNM